MKLKLEQNNGFVEPKFRIRLPKITKEEISGLGGIDWEQYLPTPEGQKFIFDTNCCMTYSSTNLIETYLNYLNASGQIPKNILERCQQLGYFDSENKFNFSDRFSAIMNGTNPSSGNNFDAVWNGHNNFGLIPEKDFTYTKEDAQKFIDPLDFWKDYFDSTKITQEMKDKAKIFKQLFDINLRWIIVSGINGVLMNIWNTLINKSHAQILRDNLQTSIVQLGIPACPTWNDGIVKTCSILQAQHGVMAFYVKSDDSIDIFDQYSPYVKTLTPNYTIPYAVAINILVKQKPQYIFNNNLSFGQTNREIIQLQRCLAYLGYFTATATGYYGPITAKAVLQFQKEYNISPTSEENCGPKTRTQLNLLFGK